MEHDIHSEKDDYSTLLKFIKYFYFNFLRNEKNLLSIISWLAAYRKKSSLSSFSSASTCLHGFDTIKERKREMKIMLY